MARIDINPFLNRINPATGMYWTGQEAAAGAGASPEEMQKAITQAQAAQGVRNEAILPVTAKELLSSYYANPGAGWTPGYVEGLAEGTGARIPTDGTGGAQLAPTVLRPENLRTGEFGLNRGNAASLEYSPPRGLTEGAALAGTVTRPDADRAGIGEAYRGSVRNPYVPPEEKTVTAGENETRETGATSGGTVISPPPAGREPASPYSSLVNYFLKGGTMKPGAMTLATLLSEQPAESWMKPGFGYGDIGWGGQPTGRSTYWNEAGEPFRYGTDTKAYWYQHHPGNVYWQSGELSPAGGPPKITDIRDFSQLPWEQQARAKQTADQDVVNAIVAKYFGNSAAVPAPTGGGGGGGGEEGAAREAPTIEAGGGGTPDSFDTFEQAYQNAFPGGVPKTWTEIKKELEDAGYPIEDILSIMTFLSA